MCRTGLLEEVFMIRDTLSVLVKMSCSLKIKSESAPAQFNFTATPMITW